jgi:hypothetical protein
MLCALFLMPPEPAALDAGGPSFFKLARRSDQPEVHGYCNLLYIVFGEDEEGIVELRLMVYLAQGCNRVGALEVCSKEGLL